MTTYSPSANASCEGTELEQSLQQGGTGNGTGTLDAEPETSLWDSVVAFLLSAGYRRYEQGNLREPTTKKVLFQRELQGVSPVCLCNDKLFVNVTLFELALPTQTLHTAEVTITAETPDEHWANLTLYNLNLKELLEQEAQCVRRLTRAWQALNDELPR